MWGARLLPGRTFAVEERPFLVKLATIGSSVLLVSGCISYRAGALDWLTQTDAPPADAKSGSPSNSNASAVTPEPIFLPSSKVGVRTGIPTPVTHPIEP
jgi:hypothetical protein